jgi:ornithine lipid hydroxylase
MSASSTHAVPTRYSVCLYLLTALFALRVAAQAIQQWVPLIFLPEFGRFQGSNLPYGVLLTTQLLILAAMTWAAQRVGSGRMQPHAGAGRLLLWLGGIYFAGSMLRILVGLTMVDAPAWFTHWIPAAFHLVLAGFVLTMAAFHLQTSLLDWLWYPVAMLASVSAYLGMVAGGMMPAVAAYLPIVLSGLTVVVLEIFFPAREDWKPKLSDVLNDAAFMAIVQVALARLLGLLGVLWIATWAHEHLESSLWPGDWPLILQIILMVFAVDLMRYWLHRAAHKYTVLWRLHEVHHSPDIIYVLNVGRFHPLEKVLQFSLDSVPFLLLGVAPEVLAGYFVFYSVNGFFQHSNLRLHYGWLNYVVGSAETHRWHHARDPKLAYCNFGNTVIVWDLLFGTWYLPGPVDDIGIPDRDYPKNFYAQMLMPFKRRRG